MSKKKIMTMLTAIGLTVVIGIGATLAFYSDKTPTATNTFTVGKVDIDLEEPNWNPDNGLDMYPGKEIDKDPTVTVNKLSADSYVFVEVKGADQLEKNGFTINGWSDDWKKYPQVAGDTMKDGIYVWSGVDDNIVKKNATGNTELASVFTSVTFNGLEANRVYAVDGKGNKIKDAQGNYIVKTYKLVNADGEYVETLDVDITAYAIQANGGIDKITTVQDAYKALFTK